MFLWLFNSYGSILAWGYVGSNRVLGFVVGPEIDVKIIDDDKSSFKYNNEIKFEWDRIC